jgi:hypothetical protein
MLISLLYQPAIWACSVAAEVMMIIHSENSCKSFYFTTMCTNRGKWEKQFYIVSFLIIVIIIIIIIILSIFFVQGIYTYIPETNYVPREHCVATILM